jgi:hypothetical protein
MAPVGGIVSGSKCRGKGDKELTGLELLLSVAGREETQFRDVISEAVRRLTVLVPVAFSYVSLRSQGMRQSQTNMAATTSTISTSRCDRWAGGTHCAPVQVLQRSMRRRRRHAPAAP